MSLEARQFLARFQRDPEAFMRVTAPDKPKKIARKAKPKKKGDKVKPKVVKRKPTKK